MAIVSPSKVLDVRALAHTREIVAYRDGGEFPVLTTTPSGALIAVLRGGVAGHLGRNGRIDIVRSLDGGQSWTYPNIVADSVDDDRNPGIGTSKKGTVILSYSRASSYDDKGAYFACERADTEKYWSMRVTRSFDNGLTWEEPFGPVYAAVSSCSPYGKMVTMPDGTILMPCYGKPSPEIVGDRMSQILDKDTCSYLLRSRDDGKTWGDPSLIWINSGEPGVLRLANGDLFAALRREQMGKSLWGSRSSDGGYTWSEPAPIIGDMKHPADLLQLSNGYLLMAYGNRNTPPARVEGLVSKDNGKTWLDVVLTFSGQLRGYNLDFPRHVDLGYPTSVIVPGSKPATGVTMYYYNPSIEKRSDGLRRNESAYSNINYVAIAVVWSESELIAAIDKAV